MSENMVRNNDYICQIENLHVSFFNHAKKQLLKVVRGVSFNVKKGEILGIVGESGSGKSVSAASMMRLHHSENACVEADQIEFDGMNLLAMNEMELEKIRGKRIAMIFQNPVEALCPHKRILSQFVEGFKIHGMKGEETTLKQIVSLLNDMGIEDAELTLGKYPHQLSGGQAQRVAIAMALSLNPDLIIADEPTSAIDASLSQLILDRLKWINETYGIGIILITHDFDVAQAFCHRILVMYGGLVLEERASNELISEAWHPYTIALMNCVHSLKNNDEKLYTLPGTPLDPQAFDNACPFSARCEFALSCCFEQIPDIKKQGDAIVRCFNPQNGGKHIAKFSSC